MTILPGRKETDPLRSRVWVFPYLYEGRQDWNWADKW
jgi:hypothetical protein